MTRPPSDTLGLAGDGDELDLLGDVERSFGVDLRGKELATVLTVGDLFGVVAYKMGATANPRQACLSMAAFHKLRVALPASACGVRIGPETDLKSLLGTSGLKCRWHDVGRQSGLVLPGLSLTPLSEHALAAAAVVGVVAGLWVQSWLPPIFAVVVVSVLAKILPRELRDDVATLRRLMPIVIARNFGNLAREYRTCHIDDVWQSFVVLMRDHALPRCGVITRETRLLARRT